MHTARRAGGGNIAFTLAVVCLLILVMGGFVWRAFSADADLPPAASEQVK
jgi:hypothetical protein